MNATSSQDQFAKWAKLRRQHDKTLAEYDQISTLRSFIVGVNHLHLWLSISNPSASKHTAQSLNTFKTSFDSAVSIGRWTATNGVRFFLQFWYAKQAMFWLPKGWVPGYVEWILAFPRAQTGSVSIQVWGLACGTVVRLVSAAIVAMWVLIQENTMGWGGREKQGMEMGGRGDGTEGMQEGNVDGKKEL